MNHIQMFRISTFINYDELKSRHAVDEHSPHTVYGAGDQSCDASDS